MLDLKINYKNKTYRKKLEDETESPLHGASVADAVLARLEAVERGDNLVDTQEIAIIAGLLAEHEYCKQKDSYKRTLTEAGRKISELKLELESAMSGV
ncbi:MAG: hypothetical protein CVU77_06975 [Elusimicrobia bacterium HGW-Elusimicrobia-1]|jgi:cell division protein ZapA (FtsZ GTPase activity inhibitor)|nr:MAG: hypothetical protein CVU77_06975 [Elusimicrobia bacterium HGW-Elusimicrobia-1]